MKVLFDTNIILDFLLAREPFVAVAEPLFQRVELGQLEGYVAAISLNNLFYLIRKVRGGPVAYAAVSRILSSFAVCPVSRQTLENALQLNLKDFEDAIQLACALAGGMDGIVTRNTQDFVSTQVAIWSPEQFVALYPHPSHE